MNIFFVELDPVAAARALCDRHVIKMALESAQLLCGPFPTGVAPYGRTHHQHPSAIWLRSSAAHYRWLLAHANALCDEYTRRYGREHASAKVIAWCAAHEHLLALPERPFEDPPQAMPDEYRRATSIEGYRAYYHGAKARFATWRAPSQPPPWWSPTQGIPPETSPAPKRPPTPRSTKQPSPSTKHRAGRSTKQSSPSTTKQPTRQSTQPPAPPSTTKQPTRRSTKPPAPPATKQPARRPTEQPSKRAAKQLTPASTTQRARRSTK